MAIGLTNVPAGFFGGLVDGFKETKTMLNKKRALDQQQMAIDLSAQERGLRFGEGGTLRAILPGEAGFNPQAFAVNQMLIDNLTKMFQAQADMVKASPVSVPGTGGLAASQSLNLFRGNVAQGAANQITSDLQQSLTGGSVLDRFINATPTP
jgi:hypothetical protein